MAEKENIKLKKITTYIEDDYQTAYAKARRELGPNLVIVEKKEIKVGGFMGILAKNKIKVTYGVEDVQISLSAPKNKQENKDILELLQKMGYDGKKDGSNKKEFNLMENENEGVKLEIKGNYSPYRNKKAEDKPKNIVEKKSETVSEINEKNSSVSSKENKAAILDSNEIEKIKESLKKEITEELKKEITGVVSEEFIVEEFDIEEKLREKDVDKNLAKKIKKYIETKGYNKNNYESGLKEYFIENIKVSGGFNSKFVMFIGPTGVGKTTSSAKIVANKWREEHDVGFITADTYRLEAVSQLKAYANIMKVPVEVIKKPEELPTVMEKFKEKDFVIIDTAGRSPKNKEQMEELKNYLKSIGITIEVCLVLSSTAKLSVMYETIDKFSYIGFNSIIFTKIDETNNTGSILSVCDKYNLPVSYITTGQRVPGDIEVATKERLAEIFFKEL